MILALDNGLENLGWAVVAPRTGHVEDLGVIHQRRIAKLDESTCRVTRLLRQGRILRGVAITNHCTAIAAEAMSFGGPPKARFAMAIALGGSWGVAAALAAALDLELWEVSPKRWQHEILGRAAGDQSAVDYMVVFEALRDYIGSTVEAAASYGELPEGRRNHALDAVGVGIFTALRPDEATRIGGKS